MEGKIDRQEGRQAGIHRQAKDTNTLLYKKDESHI